MLVRTDPNTETIASERPRGVFSRQVILGDSLDTEHIQASFDAGVLRLTIGLTEKAKPRKIENSGSRPGADGDQRQAVGA